MKKIVSVLLLAIGLAASAHAAVVAGASIGYLLDSEEAYYSARLGYEFKSATSLSHQVEVEYGYCGSEESGVEISIAPLTANYRLTSAKGAKFSYHAGAGAGVAQIDIDYLWYHGDSQPFVAQAFVGADYHVTKNVSLNVDAKYLWIDNIKVLGSSLEVGDDVILSAGISFKF